MSKEDDDILAVAREGFLEEARDMLKEFEQALLQLEADPQDSEAMNSAFRAAHTIKGTSGLFGYEEVVAFTHEVESVLESMRSEELQLTPEAVAALLEGRDQMAALIDAVTSANPRPDPERDQASQSIGQRLRALRGSPASSPAASARSVGEAPQAIEGAVWHVSLWMGEDALRNGMDPLSFIRYLSKIGQVLGVRTLTAKVPELDSADPEACYLAFEIRLASTADRGTIESVFEFLAEDSDLAVLGPAPSTADHEALLQRRGTTPELREAVLALWQQLAGPGQPPFIERRDPAQANRREQAPERRKGRSERRGGDESRFIRVRADKLDRLIDLIGELVIASSGAQMVARAESSPTFGEAATRIHDLVQEARDGALSLRMVPIGETFSRFQRVVRDVSLQLGKQVELQITGGDTELDKSMVEVISDPLMHLVRNSLDHGLETPEQRQQAGKPETGRLALHAYHESGSVVIEVTDDGRGLNREKILAKALERGLIDGSTELTDEQVHLLIFEPGFSTADAVTNLSGRGVGMDVVRRNIESLRGQIKVASQSGRGATIQIRLPLTLAIIDGFLTQVGGVSYVLPLERVAECLEVPEECLKEPERVAGHFDLRGEVLPYLDVGRFYRHSTNSHGRRSLVLVKDGSARVGLVVERLLGEHQTVIKPLGRVFQNVRGLAGSTILGSGEVALILDVSALLALATSPHAHRPGAAVH